MKYRIKRKLAAALLLCVSILISLLAADYGLLRWLIEENPGPLVPGTHHQKNCEYDVKLRVEKNGFRAQNFNETKSGKNVLLLGDSFVEGIGLKDGETYSEQLNSQYNSTKFSFFNAGERGAHLLDYLKNYETLSEKYRFDVVKIFIYLGNDISDYDLIRKLESEKTQREAKIKEIAYSTPVGKIKKFAYSLFPRVAILYHRARQPRLVERAAAPNTAISEKETIQQITDWVSQYRTLQPSEVSKISERYRRLPARIRNCVSKKQANIWRYSYLHWFPFDPVYNLNTPKNRKNLNVSLRELRLLIDSMTQNEVYVYLVPHRYQVDPNERKQVSDILKDDFVTEETQNLTEVNRQLALRLHESHPTVKVIDLTAKLQEQASEYYYEMDAHLTPTGAKVVAATIKAVLEGSSIAME